MSQFDLQLLRQFPDLNSLEFRSTLNSTNDFAISNLETLAQNIPALVLTDQQTAGRGRGENMWWSEPGALTFSLVENTESMQLPLDRIPTLALAVGMATQRLVSELTSKRVTVKWPNDVYLDGKKCCGILIEQKRVDGHSFLIIGVGINVNNSIQSAPSQLQQTSASLCDAVGYEFDMTQVLTKWLNAWQLALRDLVQDAAAFFSQLNDVSLLNGRRVQVDQPGHSIKGTVEKIDESGRLLLQTAGKLIPVVAGSVLLLENETEP